MVASVSFAAGPATDRQHGKRCRRWQAARAARCQRPVTTRGVSLTAHPGVHRRRVGAAGQPARRKWCFTLPDGAAAVATRTPNPGAARQRRRRCGQRTNHGPAWQRGRRCRSRRPTRIRRAHEEHHVQEGGAPQGQLLSHHHHHNHHNQHSRAPPLLPSPTIKRRNTSAHARVPLDTQGTRDHSHVGTPDSSGPHHGYCYTTLCKGEMKHASVVHT